MRSTLKEPLLVSTSTHEEKLRSWVSAIDVPLLFGLQTCTAGVALTESPRGAIGYACGAGALLVICGVCQACAGSRAGGAVRAAGGAAAMAAGAFQLAVPNALAVLCVALAVGFLVRNDLGATPTAIANMTAVTKHYGAATKAFLILPLVSAFFVDLANALIIRLFLSF